MRVGGGTIQESRYVKNLGVMFDRHLSWNAHVSDVVQRCIGLLIGPRQMRHFLLPRHAMLASVQGLVLSRVRYCISVYGNGSVKNDSRLMKVVNFATRVVTGLIKFDHVSRARDDLYLHTPRQMCDLQTAIAAHKVILYHEPADLAVLLRTHADTRDGDRVTRQDRRLRLPAMRTAAGQRSFEYRAAHLLNSMPEDASYLTPAAFKRTAK